MPRKRPSKKHPRYSKRRTKEYQQALQSDHWKTLKEEVYRETGGRCEGCYVRRPMYHLQLHHLHYRTLGKEQRKDVELNCQDCHIESDRKRMIRESIKTWTRRYIYNHNRTPSQEALDKWIESDLLPWIDEQLSEREQV